MTSARSLKTERREQRILLAAFFMLFPGFFFYHTLLGTGTMGAFLGGYFAPISLLFAVPLALIYLNRMQRNPRRFHAVDLHLGLFLLYFVAVIAVNAAAGANRTIVGNHMLGILFIFNLFVIASFLDFDSPRFRVVGLLSLAGMSAIAVSFSVEGVFYLGAMGIAKDADALATYQGFARSYLVTFLTVIAFTRSMLLRLLLYAMGAMTLFLNTARSEFAALMFAIPIIEFYYSRHKLHFLLCGIIVFFVGHLYFDQILAALPANRILELLDLSQSTSANKRHHLTVHAVQTILAHPLLGDYASYKPGYYSHNVLSAWVDLGFFGIAYLCLVTVVPIVPMFIREYFAPRHCGIFLLGFSMACVTVLLLLTSHYFTDMLIGATLGASSRYFYERKYAKNRTPDLGASTARHQDLRQAMP
ncbi:hypothetical protein [Massilia sp. Leaf139]|uniref:hypothetical protein n=1 Tax=Massilia sp. Leaf139 TaxID=1736272 RepID=UPI0006FD69C9|nr:hypothetical protein [Massilia sp. Leaf139]KQQ89172.1 hypothetical protein ASF77_10900 [Massilia sp. Leaf139]